MSAALPPQLQKLASPMFLQHPLLKYAGSSGVMCSWVVFSPQSARLPHPVGWRTGLGSGLAMTLIYYFFGLYRQSSSLP